MHRRTLRRINVIDGVQGKSMQMYRALILFSTVATLLLPLLMIILEILLLGDQCINKLSDQDLRAVLCTLLPILLSSGRDEV